MLQGCQLSEHGATVVPEKYKNTQMLIQKEKQSTLLEAIAAM
jgi:protein-L-isoaspartate O-methyltransferase